MSVDTTNSDRLAMAPFFGKNPPQELVVHVPHAEVLGLSIVELGPGMALFKLPYADNLVADPATGVVFGGTITTLLDQCSGLAVFSALTEIKAIATLDLRIDYLRAAEPGRDLFGRSTCFKLTKHVGFIRAFAWENDESDPFATCNASFMLGANATSSPLAKYLQAAKSPGAVKK